MRDAGDSDRGQQGVGRPPALKVEQVVDEAIALADEEGIESLSMAKLARRLGVGTMTIYGYVTDKQHLLDLVAERIFEDLEVGDEPVVGARLKSFFHDFRQAALARPALALLLAGGRITIPAVFDTLEKAFEPVADRREDVEQAVRAFYAALTYTLGFVLWEIPRTRLQSRDHYTEQWTSLLAGLDPDTYPILTGPAQPTLTSTASDDQFHWGLDRLLEGLADSV